MALGPENEEEYFRDLSAARQLEYIEDTWGVKVSVMVTLVVDERRRWVVVGSADVHDMFHRRELNEPPAAVLTSSVNRHYDHSRFVGKLLWVWMKTVRDHLNETTSPP